MTHSETRGTATVPAPPRRVVKQPAASRGSAPPVTFIAMLAPPVCGNTVVSSIVLKALQDRCGVRVSNLSPKTTSFGTRFKLLKLPRVALAICRILCWSRPDNAKLYAVADDGFGMFYTIAVLLLARVRGYRIVLQHHSYAYVRQRDWRMAIGDRLLRGIGVHIFLCCQHAKEFRAQYDSTIPYVIVPSTVLLADGEPIDTKSAGADVELREDSRFQLGMISILMLEKGIDTVAQTFESARNKGLDVVLHLAGPCPTSTELRLIDELSARYGSSFRYWGPVYGSDKARFFETIDVMLFPTRYKTEAQPIVIGEAFAAGVPVLANALACIPSLIGDTAGSLSIPPHEFVDRAAKVISDWIDQPATHREARVHAARRAAQLREDAHLQIRQLTDMLSGELPWPSNETPTHS